MCSTERDWAGIDDSRLSLAVTGAVTARAVGAEGSNHPQSSAPDAEQPTGAEGQAHLSLQPGPPDKGRG